MKLEKDIKNVPLRKYILMTLCVNLVQIKIKLKDSTRVFLKLRLIIKQHKFEGH